MPMSPVADRFVFHCFRSLALAVVGTAIWAAAAPAPAEEHVLFNFERPGLVNDWSAVRKVTVVRQRVPAFSGQDKVAPAGYGVRISSDGGGGLFAKSGKVPQDWRGFESVSFWVYRSPQERQRHGRSTVEVQVFEEDGKARFWRRVDLDHEGWLEVTLPLRWFRFGKQRLPRWDRVDRFGIWFRDAAEVTVDTISLQRGETKIASELTVADLIATAFPDRPPRDIRVRRTTDVRLLTDAPGLDADQLVDYLTDLARTIRRDLKLAGRPSSPATLIVFADRQQYQEFPGRLAARMNSVGFAPGSAGFTTHGISTSYWDDRFGTFRPVYTHEFVHSLVAHGVFLSNRGEWFHEGLASYYQLQIHPQEDFSQIVRRGLADGALRSPLEQLLSGKGIPGDRYWQAATVIEMLVGDEKYRSRLPALFAAFRDNGSTDIVPHLQPVLKVTLDEFERDWLAHCRRAHGAAAN